MTICRAEILKHCAKLGMVLRQEIRFIAELKGVENVPDTQLSSESGAS